MGVPSAVRVIMRICGLRAIPLYPVAAVALIVLGVALRLYQIEYSFESDELFSVSVMKDSLGQAVDAALGDRPHPPLYYLALWSWLRVVPASEAGARLLSVLASAGFLVVLWRIGVRLLRPGPALFVLLLGATSPFFVHYGQQARMYSLIACFSALSVLLLFRVLEEPGSWARTLLWGSSCAALQWSQYVGVFLILPQLLAIVIAAPRQRGRLLGVGALAIGSVFPWVLAARLARPATVDVGLPGWMERPGLMGPLRFFVEIFGWLPFSGSTRLLFLVAGVTMLAVVFRSTIAYQSHLLLLLALVLAPTIALFVVSEVGPVSLWAPRQLIGAAVFVVVLLGMALGLHQRWLAVLLGCAFAAWIAGTLPTQLPAHTKPPWRALAARLDAGVDGWPIVATEEWVRRPLRHYSTRSDIRLSSEFPSGQCCGAARIVFVCRPERCSQLRDLRERYDAELQDTVTWTSEPTPTSTIQLYVLRERG